jgi:cold shock protein
LNVPAGSFSKDIDEVEIAARLSRETRLRALEKKMTTGTVKWFNDQKGISAVERAGLSGLAEGQKVNYELKTDKMRGKVSAENLSLA